MAFKIAETVTHEKGEARVSVSYSRARPSSLPRLIVGVPAIVAAGLKFPETQRFAIAFGSGSDAGKTRIVASVKGAAAAKVRSGGMTFRFGHVPALGLDAAAKEFTAHRILDPKKDGGAILEIMGPAWLKPEDERDE